MAVWKGPGILWVSAEGAGNSSEGSAAALWPLAGEVFHCF